MILAAGLGTRLKELTHDRPKALVEVAGKTLLERNLENLQQHGFDTIIVNIHHFGEQIIQFLESHDFQADIYVSDERGALMDTGGGIVQALPFFHDAPAVLVHNVEKLLFDEQGLLIGWKNLKDGAYKWVDGARDQYRELAFNGMHVFRPSLFAEFPWQRYSIIDLYLQQARAYHIRSVEINPTYWFDLGKAEDFARIESHLSSLTFNL